MIGSCWRFYGAIVVYHVPLFSEELLYLMDIISDGSPLDQSMLFEVFPSDYFACKRFASLHVWYEAFSQSVV